MHRQRGLKMFDDVGVHGANDAQLVGQRAQLREQLADDEPRLAVGRELERRRHELGGRGTAQLARCELTTAIFSKSRLGIEGINVRKAAGEKDEKESLGTRGEMGGTRRQYASAAQLNCGRERSAEGQRGTGGARGAASDESAAID